MDISQFVKQEDITRILKIIIANYDRSGLRFPIQKLILGPRALKMFGSKENNRLVTRVLSDKLYEYLVNTKISLEVSDGEAIMDVRMPPLSIVDRCDISLKENIQSVRVYETLEIQRTKMQKFFYKVVNSTTHTSLLSSFISSTPLSSKSRLWLGW